MILELLESTDTPNELFWLQALYEHIEDTDATPDDIRRYIRRYLQLRGAW